MKEQLVKLKRWIRIFGRETPILRGNARFVRLRKRMKMLKGCCVCKVTSSCIAQGFLCLLFDAGKGNYRNFCVLPYQLFCNISPRKPSRHCSRTSPLLQLNSTACFAYTRLVMPRHLSFLCKLRGHQLAAYRHLWLPLSTPHTFF